MSLSLCLSEYMSKSKSVCSRCHTYTYTPHASIFPHSHTLPYSYGPPPYLTPTQGSPTYAHKPHLWDNGRVLHNYVIFHILTHPYSTPVTLQGPPTPILCTRPNISRPHPHEYMTHHAHTHKSDAQIVRTPTFYAHSTYITIVTTS